MLTTNQQQRNPTARERRIFTALACGASRPEAALQVGLTLRAAAEILERLRGGIKRKAREDPSLA